MKGKAVNKSALADDFVYETEKDSLSSSQMKEIAKANGFKIKGKKTAELKSSFEEQLLKLKLPEKRKMTDTEKVLEIVKTGVEAKTSEDEILISVVQSGIKFQQAIKMMKNAMVSLGFAVNSKERFIKTKEILDDEEFEPENYSDVTEMIAKITEEVSGTTEGQALSQIRKYCKEEEIALPKKVKEKKANVQIKVMAWFVNNYSAETSELEEFLEEIEAPEKSHKGWVSKFEAVKVEAIKQEKAVEKDDEKAA